MELKVATKVTVKNSPGKGWGVFATKPILEGEVIEECPLFTLPIQPNVPNNLMIDYRFNYPSGGECEELVIPWGYGCLYNHSNEPNAFWQDHPRYKAFQFIAKRDIQPGEEICTYYGGEAYWNDGRTHTKVI